jgi:hypothetical protein
LQEQKIGEEEKTILGAEFEDVRILRLEQGGGGATALDPEGVRVREKERAAAN